MLRPNIARVVTFTHSIFYVIYLIQGEIRLPCWELRINLTKVLLVILGNGCGCVEIIHHRGRGRVGCRAKQLPGYFGYVNLGVNKPTLSARENCRAPHNSIMNLTASHLPSLLRNLDQRDTEWKILRTCLNAIVVYVQYLLNKRNGLTIEIRIYF